MLLTAMLKIFVRKYYRLLNLKSDSHTAVISAKLNFPPILFEKIFLLVWLAFQNENKWL